MVWSICRYHNSRARIGHRLCFSGHCECSSRYHSNYWDLISSFESTKHCRSRSRFLLKALRQLLTRKTLLRPLSDGIMMERPTSRTYKCFFLVESIGWLLSLEQQSTCICKLVKLVIWLTVVCRGNNARSWKGTYSSTSSQSASPLVFSYTQIPSLAPTAQVNIDAARVNAFYVANAFHDYTYRCLIRVR